MLFSQLKTRKMQSKATLCRHKIYAPDARKRHLRVSELLIFYGGGRQGFAPLLITIMAFSPETYLAHIYPLKLMNNTKYIPKHMRLGPSNPTFPGDFY